jgi:hypothetical protein
MNKRNAPALSLTAADILPGEALGRNRLTFYVVRCPAELFLSITGEALFREGLKTGHPGMELLEFVEMQGLGAV